MFRRMIPLAIALAVIVGCGKKKGDDDTGGGNDGKVDSDPSTAFTIKIRDPQEGDKVEVTDSETMNQESTSKGKTEKSTSKKRLEYTEHITEMPAGSKQPNKVTRTYKVAQRTDYKTKDVKALGIEGKTVSAEKKQFNYEFVVDGKKLDFKSFDDYIDFDSDLRKSDKKEVEAMLPKNPVKVGESWTITPEAAKQIFGGMGGPGLDTAKSKFNCKLSRAYTKDGKQWGIIAFDFDVTFDAKAAGKASGDGGGTVKADGTLETVIDGSARDGTMKTTVKGSFNVTDGKGEARKGTIDGTGEKTVKTVK